MDGSLNPSVAERLVILLEYLSERLPNLPAKSQSKNDKTTLKIKLPPIPTPPPFSLPNKLELADWLPSLNEITEPVSRRTSMLFKPKKKQQPPSSLMQSLQHRFGGAAIKKPIPTPTAATANIGQQPTTAKKKIRFPEEPKSNPFSLRSLLLKLSPKDHNREIQNKALNMAPVKEADSTQSKPRRKRKRPKYSRNERQLFV